jgi:parallel beta-helix repeat protein
MRTRAIYFLLLTACTSSTRHENDNPAAASPTPAPTASSDAGGGGGSTDAANDVVTESCLSASDPESKIADAFVTAKDGSTICLGAGTFKLTNTLTVAGSKVTVRGAGIDQTTLDFSGQKAGSEGILTENAKDLVLESFSVVDTKGNGIKALDADGITMRKIGVRWTGADASAHGPYGLYPVQSKRVLVEDCVVTGASDAGIYLGQSDGSILRRNKVSGNVAGIEVENTYNADVYQNEAKNNTGGILVFDLPGLPQKAGHGVRVFANLIEANNTENFAPEGNIVGIVPRGTGFLVMANHTVEVFGNTIKDNTTVNAAVVSYVVTGIEITDPQYYPFPAKVFIHDNTFGGGGNDPDPTKDLGMLLAGMRPYMPNEVVPSITYDGIVDPTKTAGANVMELCLKNNGAATFGNLHLDQLDPEAPDPSIFSYDATPHDCTLPAIPAQTFAP